MNVKFDKIDNVNGLLTISIVEDDYRRDVKSQLAEVGRRRAIKGFRPGHVPAGMLQKLFGPEVLSNVVDRLVSRELSKYIVDNKLRILGQPMLDPSTHVDMVKEKDFEFKFNIGLAPELDVKVDKNVKLPYYIIGVTDEMVNDRVEAYRNRYSKEAESEMVTNDGYFRCTLTEVDDKGNPVEGGIVAEHAIIAPRYVKNEDERNRLVGLKVGETITYNPHKATEGNINEMAALLGVDKDKADVKSDFSLTVVEAFVNEPADMNQEFFDQVLGIGEAHSEEEFRTKLRETIAAQNTNDSNYRFAIDARKQLTDMAGDFELPDELLKNFLKANHEEGKPEDIDEQYPAMRKQLQWQIVRDDLCEKMGVTVEPEDKKNLARLYAAQQFAQYGLPNVGDEMLDNYAQRMLEDERTSNEIEDRAREDKLYAAIKAAAIIEEKTVTVDEFQQLFKDDAPEAEAPAAE